MSSDISEFDPPYGYAIRRHGSCNDEETECYDTWGGYWACCPGESHCPGASRYLPNNVCCPGEGSCLPYLQENPHCANSSWTMFNHKAYFCCQEGQYGFWTVDPPNNFGCSDEYPDDANYTVLTPVSQGSGDSITSKATSTSTATASATGSPDDDSSNNTGAIAGGVVGGVVGAVVIIGAVWFFLRRQRSSKKLQPAGSEKTESVSEPTDYGYSRVGEVGEVRELEARGKRRPELDGSQANSPAVELPS